MSNPNKIEQPSFVLLEEQDEKTLRGGNAVQQRNLVESTCKLLSKTLDNVVSIENYSIQAKWLLDYPWNNSVSNFQPRMMMNPIRLIRHTLARVKLSRATCTRVPAFTSVEKKESACLHARLVKKFYFSQRARGGCYTYALSYQLARRWTAQPRAINTPECICNSERVARWVERMRRLFGDKWSARRRGITGRRPSRAVCFYWSSPQKSRGLFGWPPARVTSVSLVHRGLTLLARAADWSPRPFGNISGGTRN